MTESEEYFTAFERGRFWENDFSISASCLSSWAMVSVRSLIQVKYYFDPVFCLAWEEFLTCSGQFCSEECFLSVVTFGNYREWRGFAQNTWTSAAASGRAVGVGIRRG